MTSQAEAVGSRRRILVTGGSSGIGRAVASRLSASDDVWLWGSRAETASEAASSMSVAGHDGVEVTDFHAVQAGIVRIVAELGGVDGVFINAGIDGAGQPAQEVSPENFRRVLDVNVIGAFNVAKAVIPSLSRPGSVVFNASVNALRPEAHFVDYNASKAAVVSMAQTFALELAEQGITVIAVCPGYFPTRMTESYLSVPDQLAGLLDLVPARRLGELSEIASVVDFLLSDGARFMSGAVVPVDGGRSI